MRFTLSSAVFCALTEPWRAGKAAGDTKKSDVSLLHANTVGFHAFYIELSSFLGTHRTLTCRQGSRRHEKEWRITFAARKQISRVSQWSQQLFYKKLACRQGSSRHQKGPHAGLRKGAAPSGICPNAVREEVSRGISVSDSVTLGALGVTELIWVFVLASIYCSTSP